MGLIQVPSKEFKENQDGASSSSRDVLVESDISGPSFSSSTLQVLTVPNGQGQRLIDSQDQIVEEGCHLNHSIEDDLEQPENIPCLDLGPSMVSCSLPIQGGLHTLTHMESSALTSVSKIVLVSATSQDCTSTPPSTVVIEELHADDNLNLSPPRSKRRGQSPPSLIIQGLKKLCISSNRGLPVPDSPKFLTWHSPKYFFIFPLLRMVGFQGTQRMLLCGKLSLSDLIPPLYKELSLVIGLIIFLSDLKRFRTNKTGIFNVLSSVRGHMVIPASESLAISYYQKRCPQAESIIYRKVNQWINSDYTLGGAILRLHFHDCAVRGCDASILLNHTGSERHAPNSQTLRGFALIDDIKAELEKICPKTVSCADILTAAARDATVKLGGPFWEVPMGRKDGLVSIAKEADVVPMGHESVTQLIEFCQARGLNIVDLVVLSGAHTIGRSTCGSLQYRLYNFNGTGKPDPSIDWKYLNFLRRKCRWASEFVDLDATTPTKFDAMYYTNLEKKMGLLATDQKLFVDARTQPLVTTLANQPYMFTSQFAVSMVNLGNVQVLTGIHEGEIRENCNLLNPRPHRPSLPHPHGLKFP
ncbi:peroxidase 7-like [Macadamia integrifolia]|uniref:peroxidase 7-like n=1 Tax=Macadamia integrifolia TaxID=60698 RepID=UPI001C52EBA5|nr:peroxidase 7-like [Macadamia integrifolia]